MGPIYYPIHEYGPLMKGLVIGGLGIFHVFTAHFAIGGGMLMCWFQWLAMRGRCEPARKFLDSYFSFLVLVSFVTGALTGVGMWFTSIQVSPRTIGLLVREFHWVWGIEWTFFCLEIVAGYCFLRYRDRLADRSRMILLILYTTAAWFSLFWINGILAFQLTPGGWRLDNRDIWSGFFNPGFWPSLLYRTVACMATAALVGCIVINFMRRITRDDRRVLVSRSAALLWPITTMPLLGAWYLGTMPADSREWVLGGAPAMTMFLGLCAGASALIGIYALVGLLLRKLYVNGATAALLTALAFGATAAGEFVREGARKPFTVRQGLYSNSITPQELSRLRSYGSVTDDPYPLKDRGAYPHDQLRLGAKVYRFQCSVCHTMNGVNALVHLTKIWSTDQKRMNIARLQYTKPFMPPFAGNAEELEALVQLLEWEAAGRPASWPVFDPVAGLDDVRRWLKEAGVGRANGGGD